MSSISPLTCMIFSYRRILFLQCSLHQWSNFCFRVIYRGFTYFFFLRDLKIVPQLKKNYLCTRNAGYKIYISRVHNRIANSNIYNMLSSYPRSNIYVYVTHSEFWHSLVQFYKYFMEFHFFFSRKNFFVKRGCEFRHLSAREYGTLECFSLTKDECWPRTNSTM